MHSVKKIWRWSCQGRFAALVTPSAKSEETLVPSQSVIGEIKMSEHLANGARCLTARPAAWQSLPALDSGTESSRLPVKVRSVKKVRDELQCRGG